MKKYWVLSVVVFAVFALQGCSRQAKSDPVEEADDLISDIEGASAAGTLAVQGQTSRDIIASSYPAAGPATTVPTAAVMDTAMTIDTGVYEQPTTQAIQEALKNAGLYTGTVDGVLGPKTKRAIREFQSMNNLSADGKVGRKTWAKLKPYLVGVPIAETPVVTGASN